jgi:glycerol kinase
MSGGDLYACVDVGTTTIKLNVYDSSLTRKHSEKVTVPVSKDGLQDGEQLFHAVRHLFGRAKEFGARSAGLATYRASTVAWDKEGRPLTPIVTWTDRSVFSTYRKLAPHLKLAGKIPPLDLIISAYSPVMKFLRLRELNPALPEGSMQWTIDAYLAYRLTGNFVSDATNACLTGIVDPRSMKEIGIVKSLFKLKMETPRVVENTERIGTFDGVELNALVADQQAASVGEWAVSRGTAKVTNGTGTFVDVPTEGFSRKSGLIPVVLLKHKGRVWFGVEGYLPTTGKAVDMMISMGLLRSYADLETEGGKGVIFIPALSGLQVPRAPGARGVIAGLDLSSDRGAIISGLLNSIAFHVRLVLEQSGERTTTLRADGGLSRSAELLNRISAATGLSVTRPAELEATSRGLAMLQLAAAGKGSLEDLAKVRNETEVFSRKADAGLEDEYSKWKSLTAWLVSSKQSFQAE